MSSTVSLSKTPTSPTFGELETQIQVLVQLLKDQKTCSVTSTYKCPPAASSIIWPILLTIAINLLNLINVTTTKSTAEAPPNTTDSSLLSPDISQEKHSTTTTTKVPAPIRRARGRYANGLRRYIQLHLLLAVTQACAEIWTCRSEPALSGLAYAVFLIAGAALIYPHEANVGA